MILAMTGVAAILSQGKAKRAGKQASRPEVAGGDADAETALEDFDLAEKEADAEARGVFGVIAVCVLLYGMLAFFLENLASGPMTDPTAARSQVTDTLERVLDTWSYVGTHRPLAVVLSLFGLEVTIAIAMSTTRIDPDSSVRAALDVERWLNVLRGCVCALAASVCFVAVGTIIGIVQDQSVPVDAPLVLVMTFVGCLLASSLVNRSNTLTVQVGIMAQLRRTSEALSMLSDSSGEWRRLRPIWAGVIPVAPALFLLALFEGTRGIPGLLRIGAVALILVVWLGIWLEGVRRALTSQAVRWAYSQRFKSARVFVTGYGTLFIAALGWALFAWTVVWRVSPNYVWLVGLVACVLLWPIGCMFVDLAPRVRWRAPADKVIPSATSMGSARVRLEARTKNLELSRVALNERRSKRPLPRQLEEPQNGRPL